MYTNLKISTYTQDEKIKQCTSSSGLVCTWPYTYKCIARTLAKIACRRKKGNPNPDKQIQGSTEVLNTRRGFITRALKEIHTCTHVRRPTLLFIAPHSHDSVTLRHTMIIIVKIDIDIWFIYTCALMLCTCNGEVYG